MDHAVRPAAIEEIRLVKARYWRGVDTRDDEMVRAILADDCLLDYRGCCTDPVSGIDHLPVMNVVLEGRDNWQTDNTDGPQAVTVHQGHQHEIEVASEREATGIWYFTDRFFMPPGSPFSRLTGYGTYHDTYSRDGAGWRLQSTRIERFWIEVS